MGRDLSPGLQFRILMPAAIAAGIVFWAFRIDGAPALGRDPAFTVFAGAAFGILLQRSRFCFFCILRELFEERDARGALGILAALAVGSLGYLVVVQPWLPDPGIGRLPPDAHIGPVSWVLVAGGLSFGVGMTLSGSCISAHLYRLGEGSTLSPFALLGAVGGFMLGFASWNSLYIDTLASAPVVWLPARLDYAGAFAVQGGLLLALALLLLLWVRWPAASQGRVTHWTPVAVVRRVFVERWPAWLGGIGVGALGFLAYLRIEPLGVTAELGSRARTLAERLGWIPDRLPGLDGFSGCATVVIEALMTPNGVFILALVAGSLAMGIASGSFRPQAYPWYRYLLALLGGVLMGWGAMVSLGCTVGVLLSGISAFALSGWVFAAALTTAVWASLQVKGRLAGGRRHRQESRPPQPGGAWRNPARRIQSGRRTVDCEVQRGFAIGHAHHDQ